MDDLVHEIHNSELQSYRRCRQQWWWQYREGYSPIKQAAALEFGKAFHRALEIVYSPDTWTTATEAELFANSYTAFDEALSKSVLHYLDLTGKTLLDPEEENERHEQCRLAFFMLENIIRLLDREEYRPVVVEQEFQVPLPSACKCDRCWERSKEAGLALQDWAGLPVVFGGRVDAILEDSAGRFWLHDHKTAAQLLKEPDYLQLDTQIGTYVWALREVYGLNITGFRYVQFKKNYPKPPKHLEKRFQGRLFSVARNQSTDYYVAERTFKERDPQAYLEGRYDDYLRWLSTEAPAFVRVFKEFKSPTQLYIVRDNLWKQVAEMLPQHWHNIYPSPDRMNCQMCKFMMPCLSRQSGFPYEDELAASYEILPPYYERERAERKES